MVTSPKRICVAKAERGSTTTTSWPSMRAIFTRACATCTAPTTTRRTGGLNTLISTSPCLPSTTALLLRAKASCSAGRSSGRTSDGFSARLCVPLARSVTSAADFRPDTVLASSASTSRFCPGTSGSTKMRMAPPHARPTAQAVSSATLNCSVFGLPEAIASAASAITAPSTQPPDTEPAKFPSPSMASWLPGGTGAEPQVCSTVARATRAPLGQPVERARQNGLGDPRIHRLVAARHRLP